MRPVRMLSLILFISIAGYAQLPAIKPVPRAVHVRYHEVQLTRDTTGHFLNSIQCFSKNDRWIVYDGRNIETGISGNGRIAMVNTRTRVIKTVYQTTGQTAYGPGAGAATFSPIDDRVLFIHGIRNANEKNPYSTTRRTGVTVVTGQQQPVFMDARNIQAPFTPGALRGGTHAFSWSGDGRWISFTYNDLLMQQRAARDSAVKDIRMVGVMCDQGAVLVPDTANVENNNGKLFAVVVTRVSDHPAWGSDEIDRAFDESWIGSRGYIQPDGHRRKRAIAFQGNLRDKDGKTKTEVFVTDLPDDLRHATAGCPLEGTDSTRPCVPAGVSQRRVTYTQHGITGPRHWLRTTPDGKWIGFLAPGENGIIQIFLVSPNGGPVKQLTFNTAPVEGPFNFSPDGNKVAYIADSSIFITRLADSFTERAAPKGATPVGAVVWDHSGRQLTYNRYVPAKNGRLFLQVFLLHW